MSHVIQSATVGGSVLFDNCTGLRKKKGRGLQPRPLVPIPSRRSRLPWLCGTRRRGRRHRGLPEDGGIRATPRYFSNSAGLATPAFRRRNLAAVASTPIPYRTLRGKLIDEASSKYRVGQLISPIRNPKWTAWARISLSKTKSFEVFFNGIVSRTSRRYARNPV